jgi:hypothetical protein
MNETTTPSTRSKPAPQTIDQLSVGDVVLLIRRGPGAPAQEIAKVERTTPTQVIVKGRRFRREESTRATALGSGNSFFRESIMIPKEGCSQVSGVLRPTMVLSARVQSF